MAKNEPNVPDNVTIINLGNKTPTDENAAPAQSVPEGGETPATEMTVEPEKSDAPPAPEEKTPEPSEKAGPEDDGGEHTPAPGDGLRLTGITFIKGTAKEAEKTAGPDKPDAAPAPEEKAPEQKAARKGRPPKADKAPAQNPPAEQDNREPWEKPLEPDKQRKLPKTKQEKAADRAAKNTPAKSEAPAPTAPEQPAQPREAPRPNGKDEIVYLNLSELHAFKDHPFGVRDDSEMKALVESVKAGGVNQPALVRPREDGGYEIIAGHRRQKASELAGYFEMPCIVREMTDDEAILAMTDDNLRQRSEILPSEKAVSLKMQVEAIKHQGARDTSGQIVQKDIGKRSVDLVGERNNMNAKQVQRYIRLTELVPDLLKAVDENRLGFTPALEISFIGRKNQNFIAVSMESEDAKPSLSQAQRMKELDSKGQLNSDVIDGIMCEQKKEEIKVIISGKELEAYFGKEKTPQQMKEQIIKLLDDWAGKEKALAAPEKKDALEK